MNLFILFAHNINLHVLLYFSIIYLNDVYVLYDKLFALFINIILNLFLKLYVFINDIFIFFNTISCIIILSNAELYGFIII